MTDRLAAAEAEAARLTRTRPIRRNRRAIESLSIRFPAGFLDRIETAAAEAESWPAEWLRKVVRDALETAERRRKRR